jgi:hypothetical protein
MRPARRFLRAGLFAICGPGLRKPRPLHRHEAGPARRGIGPHQVETGKRGQVPFSILERENEPDPFSPPAGRAEEMAVERLEGLSFPAKMVQAFPWRPFLCSVRFTKLRFGPASLESGHRLDFGLPACIPGEQR